MATLASASWQERLYEESAPQLLLYGRALGLSHCEAEDVLHDTFVSLGRLDKAPSQPRHYLLRSFRNRALNYKRRLWRRLLRELEAARWFERAPEETPAERAAMRYLAQLPTEQREVIVLKIWHEHTFEEIAQLLDISPHTAAGRYRYGMRKLRKHLERNPAYESMEHSRVPLTCLETASPIRST